MIVPLLVRSCTKDILESLAAESADLKENYLKNSLSIKRILSDELMKLCDVKRIMPSVEEGCQSTGSQSTIDYDKTEKKVKYFLLFLLYFVILLLLFRAILRSVLKKRDNITVMSRSECLSEAAQIVNMKIQTDALDDRSNQARDSMPEFLMDRYISKFNMKTAATKSLHVF